MTKYLKQGSSPYPLPFPQTWEGGVPCFVQSSAKHHKEVSFKSFEEDLVRV